MESNLNTLLNIEENGVLSFGGARMAIFDIEAGFWGLRRQMEALVGRQLADNALQQAGANAGTSFAHTFIPQASTKDVESAFRTAFRACVQAYQAAGFGKYEVEMLEWPLGRVRIKGRDTFEAWMIRQHEPQTAQKVCVYTTGVLVGFINALTGRQDIICIEQNCEATGASACLFELLPASEAESGNVIAFDPDPGTAQTSFPQSKQDFESDTHELSTLLNISQSVASTLELEPLLVLILNQFKALVAYDGAAILTLKEDVLEILAYRGPITQNEALNLRFPLAEAGVNKLVIERRQPVIIPDIYDDAPLAKAFRNTAGEQLDSTFSYIRSWMGVPLVSRNEVIGMLSLDNSQPNAYTRRHSLLARTFADQVAVAIENARLYEDEQPLAPEVKIAFYHIAQEALHNIDKHAGASSVSMHLRFIPATATLIIEDNGRGFDIANIPISSLGLGIMRERAAKIGAEIDIQSQIGEGTKISVSYPISNGSSSLRMQAGNQ